MYEELQKWNYNIYYCFMLFTSVFKAEKVWNLENTKRECVLHFIKNTIFSSFQKK